jgi:predicted TIM-barrel fold metal-dependent hydrolase
MLIAVRRVCTTMATTDTVDSIDDIHVVDCDAHLTEKQADLVPYLEDPYYSMLKQDHESEVLPGGRSFYPSAGYLTPMDIGRAQDTAVKSPEDVAEGMDLIGSNEVVLTPGLQLILGQMHHHDLAEGFAHAYNEYLLDNFLDIDDRLYGAAVVAPQKPREAAEEIYERADESDIVGVMLPFGGSSYLLGNERFYPIYEACEDVGLPLMLHNSVTACMTSFPTKFSGSSRFIETHVAIHPSDYMFHLGSMLTHGVPVRYPDLDVVVQESGLGWIPYFMRRYDHEYSAERTDAPLLEKTPSEYIHDQFYFTSQPMEGLGDPQYIADTIRNFNGEQNLMYSSDFPHMDFDHSESFFNILRNEFEPQEIRNIFGETAKEVYAF